MSRIEVGSRTLEQVASCSASEQAASVWLLRILGVGLMWIGFVLLFGPVVRLADVLPFLGNLLGFGSTVVRTRALSISLSRARALSLSLARSLALSLSLSLSLSVSLSLDLCLSLSRALSHTLLLGFGSTVVRRRTPYVSAYYYKPPRRPKRIEA
jgi:hypothetical protein